MGIKDSDETVTTVAVKMIKPTNNSDAALEALIGELKIMIVSSIVFGVVGKFLTNFFKDDTKESQN